MWVAATPQTLLVIVCVSHPGYLIYFIMLTQKETALGAPTTECAVCTSMQTLYFKPILVAKVKDLITRITFNALPHIPEQRVKGYNAALDSLALLNFYISLIETDQHSWTETENLPSNLHQKRVNKSINVFLAEFANLSDLPGLEIAKMEGHINDMLLAASRWGDEDMVRLFWNDHSTTMDFLTQWFASLQVHFTNQKAY